MDYKLYELIDMNRGGIYQDFTDGDHIRKTWWALQPYSVGDRYGDINEDFVNFVESREDYVIRRPIFNLMGLVEEFNKAISHFNEYVNKSKDPQKFARNLVNLQEYLIEQKAVDKFIIIKEDGSVLRSTRDTIGRMDLPPYDNKSSEPSIENNLDANSHLYNEDLKYNHVSDATKNQYTLTEEYIGDMSVNDKSFEVFKNPKSIKRLDNNIRAIVDNDGNLYVIDDNWTVLHNMFAGWLRSKGYPVADNTYYNLDNTVPLQRYNDTNRFYLSESIKQDEIDENIDSVKRILSLAKQKNPTITFVLKSIWDADPRDDEPLLEDRKKAWIPGSQAVTVKQKCRLGGKGDGTSVACNQGDISNLKFSPLKEEVKLDQSFVDGWHKYEILHNGDPAGEMEVSNRGDYMILNKIMIYPEHRGMGHANDAMKILTDYADKNNKILALTPDTVWGASKGKLMKWYKSWGFTLNKGRKADYKVREMMIRQPQGQNLNEVTQGGGYLAYHGSDHKIDKFSDEFVGTEEATDQEGPGIYFTTSYSDAEMYGKYLYKVKLNPRKLVDETSHDDISDEELESLIRMSPDWEMTAQNWDENPEIGLQMAIEDFREYNDSEKELFQQVWYDFFRHNPIEFVRGMVKLGYDGQIIKKEGNLSHIIVYNPNIIEIEDVEEKSLSEDIDPAHAYTEEGSLQTILDGRRCVGFISMPNEWKKIAMKNGLKMIGPINQIRGGTKYKKHIVYHPNCEGDAHELLKIVEKNGGYLPVNTPEETRKIGELLGYYKTSIDKFIERHFGKEKMVAEDVKKNLKLTPEIKEFVKQFNSGEELLRSGGLPIDLLDQAAHGFTEEGVKQLMPDQLSIKWEDDLENVKYEIEHSGLSDKEYAKKVDLSEPIDVIYENDKFYIDDGHHRYYAAKILNKPLNVNLEIKANPIKKLAPNMDYDEYHREIWNQVHNIDEGVGDKYAEKRGVKPEFSDFEDQFKSYQNIQNKEEIIRHPETTIIKNPTTLKNIGPHVRGVVDTEGNLYVEEKSRPGVIHETLLKILDFKGLVPYQHNWDEEIPQNYITVKRHEDSNTFILGESNVLMRGEEYRQFPNEQDFWENAPSREKVKPHFQKFIDRANNKHKNYNFVNEIDVYYENDGSTYDEIQSMINESNIMSLQDLPFKKDVINGLGGKIYSVGGAVRDEFLGKESKDLDILITGVPMGALEQVLSKYGKVDAVGKSFGILKFKPEGGEEIDIAIPRTEKATGEGGHKGFEVTSDYELPIEKDLERRDFTINAIAKDIEGNIIDPFGGKRDLKKKIIRVVNPEAFADDPLRMLRAVQFASRFGFKIEPQTMQMIRDNAKRIKEIPPERILTEFDKIVKKGNKLMGVQLLKDTGLFEQIFDFDIKQSTIDRSPFEDVRTMGEFIFLLTRLLHDPAENYKNNLKGDIDTYKEIKALNYGMENVSDSPVKNRSVAHNMYLYSPKSLESKILPSELERAATELLMGRFPKTVGELDVNGNDLMQLGLQGKEIGDKLKSLLINVYAENVDNKREKLLSLVGNKLGDSDSPQ